MRTTQPQQIVPVNKKWNPSGLWNLALDRDSIGGNVSIPNPTYSSPVIIDAERAINVNGLSIDRYRIVDNLNNTQGGALDIGSGDWSMLIKFKYLGKGSFSAVFSRWNTGADIPSCSYYIGSPGSIDISFVIGIGSTTYTASMGVNWTVGRTYTLIAVRNKTTISIARLTHNTMTWERVETTNAGITNVNYVLARFPMLGSIFLNSAYNADLSASLITTFKYALTESQSKELASNSWQLFAPIPMTKYSPSNSGNALLMF